MSRSFPHTIPVPSTPNMDGINKVYSLLRSNCIIVRYTLSLRKPGQFLCIGNTMHIKCSKMQPTQIKFEFNSLRNDCIFQRFSSVLCIAKTSFTGIYSILFIFYFCAKWCPMHIVLYPEEIKNKVHIENSRFLPLIYCR